MGEDDHAHAGAHPHRRHEHGAHEHEHGHDGEHVHDHPRDAHADHASGHPHHPRDAKAASRLPFVLVATFLFFVVEVVAASYAQSNALRADALHLLADVLAIAIAYAAFRVADRRPSARFTFGLRRIEAIAALINALLVLGGAIEIVRDGVEALREAQTPRSGIMLVVAAVALVVHGFNATLLHRDLHGHGEPSSPHVHLAPHRHLHVRGAHLHVLSDAVGALCTLGAAIAIRFGAPASLDPIVSFVVAALIAFAAGKLLVESILVLLESAPKHIPIDGVEREVCGVEGVECVHRLRVWSLGTGYDAIALHVTARPGADLALAAAVERRLKQKFHLDYVCVQVDPPGGHDARNSGAEGADPPA